jgi:hypothetical protein
MRGFLRSRSDEDGVRAVLGARFFRNTDRIQSAFGDLTLRKWIRDKPCKVKSSR